MRKLGLLALISVLITGCWIGQMEGYFAARGLYYGLVEVVPPETISRLESRFNRLLDETSGVTTVEPNQTIAMFNDMILILVTDVENPYGLLDDLAILFSAAGAEYDEHGNMTYVRPIARETFVYFSRGWTTSKRDHARRNS